MMNQLTAIHEVLFKVEDESGAVLFMSTCRDRADEWAVGRMCMVENLSLIVVSFVEDTDANDHTLTWRHVYDPITGDVWNTQLTHDESCRLDAWSDFYADC